MGTVRGTNVGGSANPGVAWLAGVMGHMEEPAISGIERERERAPVW